MFLHDGKTQSVMQCSGYKLEVNSRLHCMLSKRHSCTYLHKQNENITVECTPGQSKSQFLGHFCLGVEIWRF